MTASEPALPYGKKQSELNVVTKSVEFKDINKLKDNTETQSVTYDYIMGMNSTQIVIERIQAA